MTRAELLQIATNLHDYEFGCGCDFCECDKHFKAGADWEFRRERSSKQQLKIALNALEYYSQFYPVWNGEYYTTRAKEALEQIEELNRE